MALDMAALDAELKTLEKRAQLIQDIKRLAEDPEAKALLEKIARNGTGAPAPNVREYAGLSQIDAVRRAIAKCGAGNHFVVGQIGDALRIGGIGISNVAVGRVLLRLQKEGEIRIAVQGGGNVPNKYEATADLFEP